MRVNTPFVLTLLAVCLASPPLRGEEQPSAQPLLYLVLALDQPPRVVFATLATSPYVKESMPLEQFQRERQELLGLGESVHDGIAVTLQDAAGQPFFFRTYPVLDVVRGEFHGKSAGDGAFAIEHVEAKLPEPLAVVRVPLVDDSRVLIESKLGSALLDSDELLKSSVSAQSRSSRLSGPRSLALESQTGADNRVDLLIMGDGYTAAQQQKFLTDAAVVEQGFLALTPYHEYRNYVRVTKLFVTSQQSGADHPPYNPSCVGDNPACCADPIAQSDPLRGTYVNTALGARFCAFNTHRLLVTDLAAVFAAAAAVPTWDEILVVVNDTTYGGSGGALAVLSLDSQAVDLARHEYGHSFTLLADEYDTPFPGYPACSDRFGPACEANVTDETNPSLLKWSPWVEPWVPIPTPEDQLQYSDQVGLFEGARYLADDMYRERDKDCLMHFLGKPFGQVCRQEYVLRLYRGDWGDPLSGIETIEPDSPSPSATSIKKCSGALTFSVAVLQPASGPAAAVQWFVDGNPVGGATAPTFSYTSTTPQSDQVSVNVSDTTTFVHPAMANGELTSTHAWNVETLPDTLTIQNHNVAQSEVYEACDTIVAGPAVEVLSSGDLVLRAGESVKLRSGFVVKSGGELRIDVDPLFPGS